MRSSQQTLCRPSAAKRFVQNVFPAPDIPTRATRSGEESWLAMRAVFVTISRGAAIRQVRGAKRYLTETFSSPKRLMDRAEVNIGHEEGSARRLAAGNAGSLDLEIAGARGDAWLRRGRMDS